ncbi:MAG TPA: YihY/virulence factor BrkB family protein, partial [Pirellula sp.]|nr:YihY/virulence factor BrkB family protein [Pirellula sp.]
AEIGQIIEQNRIQPGTWWKSLLSLAGVLVAATGLVTAMQSSLNTVWKVKPLDGAFAIHFLWKRFFSLTMILGFGFLLLVSFLISTILAALTHYVSSYYALSGSIPNLLNQTLSLLTTWAFFAATFRWMPDARVPWSHAALGGLLTVILFTIGRAALFYYLSTTNPAAQLGSAAGLLVVILLWVYYSSSILLLGAEFTASLTPFAIVPQQGAVRVEERMKLSTKRSETANLIVASQ